MCFEQYDSIWNISKIDLRKNKTKQLLLALGGIIPFHCFLVSLVVPFLSVNGEGTHISLYFYMGHIIGKQHRICRLVSIFPQWQ